MKIMVIDDKATELKRAKDAVEKAGHSCIDIDPEYEFVTALKEMPNVDGVITDLMFCPDDTASAPETVPQGGLLVVIHALGLSKPIVICTNCYENEEYGHHGKTISWIHDSYINNLRKLGLDCPFGWSEEGRGWDENVKKEGKDWDSAVEMLLERITK